MSSKPKSTTLSITLLSAIAFLAVAFIVKGAINSRQPLSSSETVDKVTKESPYPRCPDCNLIIISATNTRADHLPTYGYKRNTMPNIESLAQHGVTFDNAFAHTSWTLPSGISIFTSTYPVDHKVMLRVPIIQFPMQDIPDAAAMSPSIAHLPGLPDILRSKGYNTFAAHGGFDYDKFYGLTSRFNEQIASPLQTQSGMIKDYGSLGASIPNALKWLEQHHNEKFFMFIQGFDAHCPFGVPTLNPEFTTGLHSPLDFSRCYWTFDTSKPVLRDGVEYYPVMTDFAGPEGSQSVQLSPDDIEYMKALYDGELATIDRMIGQFFNRLRELDLESKTIVVFLSEHGDMFGKHGRFMRGGPLRGTFYDDVLRIPLVIKNPKDPLVGRRVSQLIESVDITPSLLDMLNITPPITFRGRSFVPLITDPAAPGRQFVQAASMYTPGVANSLFNQTSVLRAVRNSHYKVISESLWPAEGTDPFQLQPIPSTAPVSEHIQLYDLVEDPNELHDIFQQNQSIAYELLSKSVPIIKRN